MNDEWAGKEITFGLAPRAVARIANLSLATLRRRVADGSISVNEELSTEETLFISGLELERLATEPRDGQPCEIEYLAATPLALQVDGEWRLYVAGEPVPPEVLAHYCRPARPRKAPKLAESDCAACQLEDRDALDEAIRAAMSSGGVSNDELARRFSLLPEQVQLHRAAGHVDRHGHNVEQKRIAERDYDRHLAAAVPLPWPRSGDSFIALASLRTQDLAGSMRALRAGDLLHPDEIERAGSGIDALVAQGLVARVPASEGIVGLAGVLLERVAELEAQVEQLEWRLARAGASS